jgi:hypothetical protein
MAPMDPSRRANRSWGRWHAVGGGVRKGAQVDSVECGGVARDRLERRRHP